MKIHFCYCQITVTFNYHHVSLHISNNLSPNLISRDITGKKRTRAFIWHQAWWGFRLYYCRNGHFKKGTNLFHRACSIHSPLATRNQPGACVRLVSNISLFWLWRPVCVCVWVRPCQASASHRVCSQDLSSRQKLEPRVFRQQQYSAWAEQGAAWVFS